MEPPVDKTDTAIINHVQLILIVDYQAGTPPQGYIQGRGGTGIHPPPPQNDQQI